MKRTILALSSALILSLSSTTFAGDTLLSIGLGIDYAKGKYGTGSTTDSISVPLTIRAYPSDRFELELIIPYIYQDSGSTTAAGMFRFGNGRKGNDSGRGNGGGNDNPDTDTSGSSSGLGDLTLKSGFSLVEEGKFLPRLLPELMIRFPTGDDDKGLGTGEFAIGAGAEVSKWFGNLYIYGEGIYNFQGSSDELELKDYFSYEAGVGYQVTDRLRPAVVVLGATAPSEFSSDMAELRGKLNFRMTGRAGLESYLGTGITRESPDFVAGLAIFYDL